MSRTCTICFHKRAEIDEALVRGDSLRAIAKRRERVPHRLLGAYDAQHRLHHVGATSYLSALVRRQVAALQPLIDRRSFTGRQPGRSRWKSGRYDTWTEIDPLFVADVAFNRIDSGQFRHPSRFLQWRLDKDPQDCLVSSLKLCNTTCLEIT